MKGGANYCAQHLQANDYYEKGCKIAGVWVGSACEAFGVKAGGIVVPEAFERLRENQHPTLLDLDGEPIQITERMHGDRVDGHERRAFYDFTISAPKTFSVAAVTGGLQEARDWHRAAVAKAVAEMEQWTAYRTNRGGNIELHPSGNFCAAHYAHDANRNLEPQLHDHLVIFNMTRGSGGKSYAIESKAFFDRVSYFTAIYRDELAAQAQRAGVEIIWGQHGEPQMKALYEQGLHEHFSRRTQEAEALIARCESLLGRKLDNNQRKIFVMASRGIDLPAFESAFERVDHGQSWPMGEAFDRMVSLVRSCADGGLKETTTAEVVLAQRASLSPEQRITLDSLVGRVGVGKVQIAPDTPTLSESISHALEHCFERQSVRKAHDVWEEAIRFGRGAGIDIKALRAEFDRLASGSQSKLVALGDELTTTLHLERERALVAAIETGKDMVLPANGRFTPSFRLNSEQRDAVAGLVGSRDRWNALIGDAGTGKTFAASELIRAHIEAGRDVFMCAPSNSARDMLRAEGRRLREERGSAMVAEPFEQAESLQKLLCDKQLQQSVGSDGLVFVDEAGLASTKMLHELMELAEKHRWRVHLQGDDKQHTSVEAGDAFRLLLAHSTMRRWRLSDIRRQTAESGLRDVSRHFAAGRVRTGLELLEARGSIIEAQGEERLRYIARDYVDLVQSGRSCLVVNRTHRENDAVSAFIRVELKVRGVLKEGHAVDTVRSLGWTAAQKRDYRNYAPGQIIEVTTGRERGKTFEVKGVERGRGIRVCDQEGRERYFNRGDSKRIDVCEKRSLEIAVGDLILLRSGQKNRRGELVNGERLQITRIEEGRIYGRSLGPDGRPQQAEIPITIQNFAHGYASTSHRSQGSTVQVALVGLDRESITQADNKMLYVASTREREDLRYYVESKAALFAHAGNISGHRKAALDLAHKPGGRRDIQRALKCKQPITVPFHQIGLKFMRGFTQLARFVTQTVHKREAMTIAAGRKIDLEHQQEIARSMHQSQGHRRIGTTQSRGRGYSP
jgi:conjugative relaxase-like TrwC/TraI family protein